MVVITLVPSSSDGDSVMSHFTPIPWKILTFQPNSDTFHPVTIPSEIAVCTVKEKENGVLTPQIGETLMKGTETILQFDEEAMSLRWVSTPPPYIKQDVYDSNTEQQSELPQTQLTLDNFVIKNEHHSTKLALCLVDRDDVYLPIIDLGDLPKDQTFTINGQLSLQAYAMAEQTVGKPLESNNCALFPLPIAVSEIPPTAFILYTQRNGSIKLE